MKKTRKKSVPSVGSTLAGAAWLSAQPLALSALSVPVMAYIIRCLGAEGYAQWRVAMSLLTVCAVLTSLGLRGVFVRSIAADPETSEAALADQLGLRMLLAAFAGVVVVLACLLLGYPSQVLWCTMIGAGGLVLTTVATTLGDLLQGHHRLKTLAAVSTGAGLTLTGASLVAAWLGAGPIGIASAYLVGPIVAVVVLYNTVRKQICPVEVRWDLSRFWTLLMGSRFFAAQQLLAAGSSQAEALMLPRLIGLSQFGFFSAGAMLVNRLTVIPDGLCTAAYPGMTKAFAAGGTVAKRQVFKYLLVAAGGGCVISVVGMVGADFIGRILFPSQSEFFTTVARVTIWALPLMAVESVLGNAINAAGKDAEQARASVPAAVVSLAGAAVLVFSFGMTGACWSMLLRPCVRTAFLAPVMALAFAVPAQKSSKTGEQARRRKPAQLRKAG